MKMNCNTTRKAQNMKKFSGKIVREFSYNTMAHEHDLPCLATATRYGLVEKVPLEWGYSEGEEDTILALNTYVGIRIK